MSTLVATVTMNRTQDVSVVPETRHAVTGNFLTGIDLTGNLPRHRVTVTLDRTQNTVTEETSWR